VKAVYFLVKYILIYFNLIVKQAIFANVPGTIQYYAMRVKETTRTVDGTRSHS